MIGFQQFEFYIIFGNNYHMSNLVWDSEIDEVAKISKVIIKVNRKKIRYQSYNHPNDR